MPARNIDEILSNRHARRSSSAYQLAKLLTRTERRTSWTGQLRALLPPEEAPHFEVASIQGQRLTVHASSAAWATRLRFRVPDLLPALRRLEDFSNVEEVGIRATR